MDKYDKLMVFMIFMTLLALVINTYVKQSPDKPPTLWEQLRETESDSAIFHRLAEQVGTPQMEYWLYLRNNKLFYCGDFEN